MLYGHPHHSTVLTIEQEEEEEILKNSSKDHGGTERLRNSLVTQHPACEAEVTMSFCYAPVHLPPRVLLSAGPGLMEIITASLSPSPTASPLPIIAHGFWA